jgi:hypothetical protein
MRIGHTVPADAYSPDADRAGPDAPAGLVEHLAHLLRLLVLLVLDRMFAAGPRRARLPSWWHYRPDLPPGSAQQLAASIRGEFGNAIAWMCRRYGIAPGHPEWTEVSRAIVAFGGSLKGLRAGAPRCPQQWWENPDIVAGMTRAPREPVTTTAAVLRRASRLLRQAVIISAPPEAKTAPAKADHAQTPAILPRPLVRRASTGPPTGPPGFPGGQFSLLCLKNLCLTNGAEARPAPPFRFVPLPCARCAASTSPSWCGMWPRKQAITRISSG